MTWHRKGDEISNLDLKGDFNKKAPRALPTRGRRNNSTKFGEAEDILEDPRSSWFKNRNSISETDLSTTLAPRQGDAYFSWQSSRRGSKSTEDVVTSKNLSDCEYLLALSDSVRASIKLAKSKKDGFGYLMETTFGSDSEKLSDFLDTALYAELQQSHPIKMDMIQYARLDKLVGDICSLENKEPRPSQQVNEQIQKAIRLHKTWLQRFKFQYFDIDNIRRGHLENKGRLQGICMGKTDWEVDNKQKFKKADAFHVSKWWLNLACAHRDSIVNSVIENKATITPYKACTIPLLTGRENVIHVHKTVYTLYSQPRTPLFWQLLSQVGNEVRILRGHELRSSLAPEAGIRYDGVWKLSGLKTSLTKDPADPTNEKLDIHQLELTLERKSDQKHMAEVIKIPTPSQMDDWQLYQQIEERKIGQIQGLGQEWLRQRREIQEQLERDSTKRAEINRTDFHTEQRENAISKQQADEAKARLMKQVLGIQNARNLKLQIPESATSKKPEEVKNISLEKKEGVTEAEGIMDEESESKEAKDEEGTEKEDREEQSKDDSSKE
ncbi:hypothetical protein QBC38DRAFT_9105 [Podospora fimiseda]|uniref:Uncharacterized protein n=1 Tax=Podospora fimiseda TaxID=252190 RepID=A0AAN7H4I4_9PEZI|nr:hypothetical protein QBC38DRAFT_9105 [Podospora fimiseda]